MPCRVEAYNGDDKRYDEFLQMSKDAKTPQEVIRFLYSLAAFRDPDGNGWLLQEVTTRAPGRIDATKVHVTLIRCSRLDPERSGAVRAMGPMEKRGLGHWDGRRVGDLLLANLFARQEHGGEKAEH